MSPQRAPRGSRRELGETHSRLAAGDGAGRADAAGAAAWGPAKPVWNWQTRHWKECRPDLESNCSEQPSHWRRHCSGDCRSHRCPSTRRANHRRLERMSDDQPEPRRVIPFSVRESPALDPHYTLTILTLPTKVPSDITPARKFRMLLH